MDKKKKICKLIVMIFIQLTIYYIISRFTDRGYLYVYSIKDDIFLVEESHYKEHKKVIINGRTGEIIFNDKYDSFNCPDILDFCITILNNKYGTIDYNGNVLINSIYDQLYYDNMSSSISGLIVKKDQKYSIIDKYENIILGPLDIGTTIDRISTNYAVVIKDEQYALVDMKGNIVIDFLLKGTVIYNIDENNQIVGISNQGKFGFINFKDDIFINPFFENSLYFSDGLACVKSFNKYGYIDKLGYIVIDFEYDYARDFINGVAHIFNGEDGFINKNNEKVIPIYNNKIKYENIKAFYSNSEKVYYIDPNGIVYYKNHNEDIGLTVNSDKYGIISSIENENNEIILEGSFKNITYINSNLFCLESNERWGCYNTSGKKIIDNLYYDIYLRDRPFIHFRKSNSHYLYDENGKLLYKNSWFEDNIVVSESKEYILIKKNDYKIISYNLKTKERKKVYEIPFTLKFRLY